MQSEKFVAECRDWIGTPFRHQGRLKGEGVDCAGLLVMAGRAIGVEVGDDLTYDHSPDPKRLRAMLSDQPGLKAVALDDEQLGDVLLLKYTATPTHLAVQSGPDAIVHAYAAARAVVEQPLNDALRARVVGRYRFQWPN